MSEQKVKLAGWVQILAVLDYHQKFTPRGRMFNCCLCKPLPTGSGPNGLRALFKEIKNEFFKPHLMSLIINIYLRFVAEILALQQNQFQSTNLFLLYKVNYTHTHTERERCWVCYVLNLRLNNVWKFYLNLPFFKSLLWWSNSAVKIPWSYSGASK